MVNKQGQTRLAQYYEWLTLEERRALEGEIVRKCLARNDQQVVFPFIFMIMIIGKNEVDSFLFRVGTFHPSMSISDRKKNFGLPLKFERTSSDLRVVLLLFINEN